MRSLLPLAFSLIITCAFSQSTASFESFNLAPESFLNGEDGVGNFRDESIVLYNDYNTNFQSWSGWAISNVTDNTTAGFGNQYSCIAGQGNEGSAHYATTFVLGESTIFNDKNTGEPYFQSLFVNNATYAYISMTEGDAFAKKFGGETGDDPDFFLLTIKAYENGMLSNDSIDFYLADYRFEDNSLDYIVDEWTYINITKFATADSLTMTLSSSDVGTFGMNTPAYFCIDDITTSNDLTTSNEDPVENLSVYPNPTNQYLNIELNSTAAELKESALYIYNSSGQLVGRHSVDQKSFSIDVAHLDFGYYWGFIQTEVEKIKFSFIRK